MNLFMCLLVICVFVINYLLKYCEIQKDILGCLSLSISKSYLYPLDTSCLFNLHVVNVFSHYVTHIFFMVPLKKQNF